MEGATLPCVAPLADVCAVAEWEVPSGQIVEAALLKDRPRMATANDFFEVRALMQVF